MSNYIDEIDQLFSSLQEEGALNESIPSTLINTPVTCNLLNSNNDEIVEQMIHEFEVEQEVKIILKEQQLGCNDLELINPVCDVDKNTDQFETNGVKGSVGYDLNQEPKISVINDKNDVLFDDDLLSLINEAKAKELAVLSAKIEKERDSKLAAEKRKKEIEKANLLSTKKWKADLRKRIKKEKDFYLRLEHKGKYSCRISDFMDDLGLVNTTSSRVTHQLFDKYGELIAKGDDLTHGNDGFFYTEDKRAKKFELFRYDKEFKERLDLGCFNSKKELFEHIAKADPIKTLGFSNFISIYD